MKVKKWMMFAEKALCEEQTKMEAVITYNISLNNGNSIQKSLNSRHED